MITENDIAVLKAVAKYRVLCRPQIGRICFPHHKSGRATRKHLSKSHRAGFIAKTKALVAYSNYSSGAPAWYLTKDGARLLCEYFDDPSYLELNTRAPREDRLHHWIAIGDSHITIDEALATQSDIASPRWINEWHVKSNTNGNASQSYLLHVVLSETPPLSASPDAGFLLEKNRKKMCYLLEQDRGTSGVRQTISSKYRGYFELQNRAGHKTIFPETDFNTFRVLVVTTTPGRRNALIRELTQKPGKELWLFVAATDLTVENFPYGSVFYDWKGEAGPLLKPSSNGK